MSQGLLAVHLRLFHHGDLHRLELFGLSQYLELVSSSSDQKKSAPTLGLYYHGEFMRNMESIEQFFL